MAQELHIDESIEEMKASDFIDGNEYLYDTLKMFVRLNPTFKMYQQDEPKTKDGKILKTDGSVFTWSIILHDRNTVIVFVCTRIEDYRDHYFICATNQALPLQQGEKVRFKEDHNVSTVVSLSLHRTPEKWAEDWERIH